MTTAQVKKPYLLADRKNHPEDTVVTVGMGDGCEPVKIGGGNFQIMAGPCSVESDEQITEIAAAVAAAGAGIIRGGAYKPRTSPYTFQGLGEEGLELLLKVKKLTKKPIISEIMGLSHIEEYSHVDIFQVGARNMQNYELLKALGRQEKPVLLKRGISATLRELLLSAEYVLAEGNKNVILCERGIRTYDHYTRNTLDLSAVPILKEMTHLPVIVDPSHATGRAELVAPMSLAAVAAGADGLMIEVHSNPEAALSDALQAIKPEEFAKLAAQIEAIRPFAYHK
ncbi:MAG: 3-deoxy-7-phosphoheptulonate synthase [Firmicutes bacterium]|nr:3-deoxy-7-phosphoheptulonate synthase [Bacillota bacterium]